MSFSRNKDYKGGSAGICTTLVKASAPTPGICIRTSTFQPCFPFHLQDDPVDQLPPTWTFDGLVKANCQLTVFRFVVPSENGRLLFNFDTASCAGRAGRGEALFRAVLRSNAAGQYAAGSLIYFGLRSPYALYEIV